MKNMNEQIFKYFPYREIRKGQDKLMEDVYNFLRNKNQRTMLFCGECGLGKEVAISTQIVGMLKDPKSDIDTVVWLVPTDSGKINISKELGKIRGAPEPLILYNKNRLCQLTETVKTQEQASAYDICSYLGNKCPKKDSCKYYKQMEKIKDAKIIVCDYNYFLEGFIRKRLFSFLKNKKVLFIINEVHLLPKRCQEVMTDEMSMSTVENAIKELNEFSKQNRQYGLIKDGYNNEREFLKTVQQKIQNLLYRNKTEIDRDKAATDSDSGKAIVPFFLNESDYDNAMSLFKLKRKIIDWKVNNDIGYSSWVEKVANFISRAWRNKNYPFYLYYIGEHKTKRKVKSCIGFVSLDPYPIMKSAFSHATKMILYSGTIYPERYTKMLRLYKFGEVFTPDVYLSPFLENRKDIFYKDGVLDLNGRKNEKVIAKSSHDLQIFLKKSEKPIGIIATRPLWDKIKPHLSINGKRLFEDTGGQEDLNEWLEKAKNYDIIYYSPFGRVSNSVDMSFLKTVILLGVPVQRMDAITREQINYLKKRLKPLKGEEAFWVALRIISILPACERAIQSVMRGLRTPKDRLTTIFFDKRWVTEQYHKFIHSQTKEIMLKIK